MTVAAGDDGVTVSWCWSRGARFDAPLWTESANRMMTDPFRLMFQHTGGLDDLALHAERRGAVHPTGFVYHLSRCGSTFVSRALGSVPNTTVLSEPAPLDHMLRAMAHQPFDDQVAAARSVVLAMSPIATSSEDQLIVKLDGWHIHLLPVLRHAFPNVPWVFLSRNPLEVMVSHERMPGAQMMPGAIPPELLGVTDDGSSIQEYGASVLAEMLRSALRHRDDGSIFVDHSELPSAIESRIAPHFGMGVVEIETATLAADAKNPAQPYTPDRASKRADASESTRNATERLVSEVHAEFEGVRHTELDRTR